MKYAVDSPPIILCHTYNDGVGKLYYCSLEKFFIIRDELITIKY